MVSDMITDKDLERHRRLTTRLQRLICAHEKNGNRDRSKHFAAVLVRHEGRMRKAAERERAL
jgi:hypothetical protein